VLYVCLYVFLALGHLHSAWHPGGFYSLSASYFAISCNLGLSSICSSVF